MEEGMLTPEQIASGWIEHDGGGCPVDPYAYIEAKHRDGSISQAIAAYFVDRWSNLWEHCTPCHNEDIIAYKPEPTP